LKKLYFIRKFTLYVLKELGHDNEKDIISTRTKSIIQIVI